MSARIPVITRRPGRRLAAAAVLAAWAGSVLVSPAQASCPALDLGSVPDAPGRVVVAGTVLQVTPAGTLFQVQRWWGAEPRGVVTIIGGRGSADPGVVTSVDWSPGPGEAWLVVGQRQAADTISTEACLQTDAQPSTLQSAEAVFGPPQEPPLADPEPASRDTEQPLPEAVFIVGGGALIGLLALSALLVLRRRRSTAS